MEREILFRGKHKETGIWIYGGLIECANRAFIVDYNFASNLLRTEQRSLDLVEYTAFEFRVKEVLPDTVCQYTGLNDKNENRIFDGDVLKVSFEDEEPLIMKVRWDEDTARFWISNNEDGFSFYDLWTGEIEVVGNIHDNKDLLEEDR